MQSIKNTSVAIMLLFLSYGVYQVIMKPLPSHEQDMIDDIAVTDPANEDAVASTLQLDLFADEKQKKLVEDSIPPKLLEISRPQTSDLETQGSFNPSASLPTTNSIANNGFAPSEKIHGVEPTYPVHAASEQQDFNNGFSTDPSFESAEKFSTDTSQLAQRIAGSQQLDSDSQVIPTAAMTDVTPRSSEPAVTEMDKQPELTLTEAWPRISALVENGDYQLALVELSRFYRANNLQANDQQRMLDWLDALAAKVIYSSEHHLRSVPYIIQPGDTIASLARQWQVPAQLIYNVNSKKIPDPTNLSSGVEIKLVQGPFDAEIDVKRGMMTLFLDEMYAGRFNINSAPFVPAGEVAIIDKSAQDHVDRPFWISLSNGASIYASENTPVDNNEIGLNPSEAEEVFSILSASSKVRILH